MGKSVKTQIDNLDEEIVDLGQYPLLMSSGIDDEEGNQIFTPDFVCDDMFNMIGMDNIIDIRKTILEPSSGDGAFTVRILDSRLKNIFNDDDYFKESLIALSTIFSIEMDRDLMVRQRNNIYTVLMLYAKEKCNIPEGYESKAKEIIKTNYIWGETSTYSQIKCYGDPIGWFMPTTDENRNDSNKIVFAKWNIVENISDCSYVLEEWEQGDRKEDDFSLGGLFANE